MHFGRYNLLGHIASGGMADVYRAEARGPHGFVKEVALKVIRSDFDQRRELIEMFFQEARLASKLTHANIVQVFDFGQFNDGRYFIAMEYVDGRTLSRVLHACRASSGQAKLGLGHAIHICSQVAVALDYAHRCKDDGRPLGLVHRDVSPQNILVSREGEVKLADFGIARAVNVSHFTVPGMKGKPAYMAPEQALGLEIDPRADVFSLGVVLWELCCEFNLFRRESELASLMAVIGPAPEIVPPSRWNPEIPPELDAAILSALDRDVAKRTQSAQELGKQLQSVLFKMAKGPEDFDLRDLLRSLQPNNEVSSNGGPEISLGSAKKHTNQSIALADELQEAAGAEGTRSHARRSAPGAAIESPSGRSATSGSGGEDRGAPIERSAGSESNGDAPTLAASPHGWGSWSRTRIVVLGFLAGGLAVVLLGGILFYAVARLGSSTTHASVAHLAKQGDTEAKAPPAPPTVESQPTTPDPVGLADAGLRGAQGSAVVELPSMADAGRGDKVLEASSSKPSKESPHSPSNGNGTTRPPDVGGGARRGATLEVLLIGPWATIYVDDKPVGYTPATVTVMPGVHELRAARKGYQTVEEIVTLEAGATFQWSPRLRPATR